MKWINRLYIFFLGIILAITTGFGIAAFYPEPQAPMFPEKLNNMPPRSCTATPESSQSAECIKIDDENRKEQVKYQQELQVFNNKNAGYTRTAIFLGVTLGTLYALLGIIIIKRSKLVANGLMLGGLLTALLTRVLISLASLGSSVTSTNTPDSLAYAEFGILVVLSIAVIFVGLQTLKDDFAK